MDHLPRRTIVKIVLSTILICSFIPGLHRLGPYLLHSTAHRLDQTAHLLDRASGYPHHPPTDD
jgi:hypothetical protein